MANPKKKQTEGPDDLYIQALLLSKVIVRILKKKAEIDLSSEPTMVVRPITEFRKRMRVSSFDKFPETTYISCVNFYRTEEDLEAHKALGAIVVYIGENYIVKLFQSLNYPITDEDDQDLLADACGTLCNLIAGNFKSGLKQLGFEDVVMSAFSTFQNEVINGLEYSPDQKQKYEISFEIKGVRRIMAEITMGVIPKVEDTVET